MTASASATSPAPNAAPETTSPATTTDTGTASGANTTSQALIELQLAKMALAAIKELADELITLLEAFPRYLSDASTMKLAVATDTKSESTKESGAISLPTETRRAIL